MPYGCLPIDAYNVYYVKYLIARIWPQLAAEARLEQVRRAVAALPEKQRAAVLMHKYQDMDYVQIGAVLSCSTSAVKSLLFRAYETLRARLNHMAAEA